MVLPAIGVHLCVDHVTRQSFAMSDRTFPDDRHTQAGIGHRKR